MRLRRILPVIAIVVFGGVPAALAVTAALIITKHGGNLATHGSVSFLFKKMGVFRLDPAGIDLRVPDALSRQLQDLQRRGGFRGAPVPVVAFGLSAWTRLHGLVTLEVFGHLAPAVGDGTALFEQELYAIVRQSGLRG